MNTSRRVRVFTSITTLALALTVAAGLASADQRDHGKRGGAASAAGCDHDQARGDRDPARRRDLAMGRDRDEQRPGDFWRDRADRDDRDQGLRAGRDDRDQGLRGGRDDRDQGLRGDRRDDRADARPGRPTRPGKHHGRAQGRRAPGRNR